MGTLSEIRASFGDDFFAPSATAAMKHNWAELCVCGHLDRYHSVSTGGTYQPAVPDETRANSRGEEWQFVTRVDGCVGAMRSRNVDRETVTRNPETRTEVTLVHPTCPCEEFRPVAKVDRPNRFFNQRMPADRKDHTRHPFMLGIRAFTTHLSRRKAATADSSWAEAEFDRRFTWLEGKRRCSISACRATADVWPAFVDADGELSELRCSHHRS